MLLNFLSMANNYEQRKVENTKLLNVEIDTCAVTDSIQPYETGICSPFYNEGEWVIVEMYENKNAAINGHKKWVSIFSKKKLPKELKDVSTCEIAQFASSIGINLNKTIKKNNKLSK